MITKEEILTQEKQTIISQLIQKKGEYVERLDIGGAKIEEARAQGKNVSNWEDYWIGLLREYEVICDKLKELGYTEA